MKNQVQVANFNPANEVYIDDVKAAFAAVAMQVGLVVLIIIALTVGVSLFIRRWLLQALGGEVASTKALVERVAAGDFSINFALKAGDNASLLAALSGLVNQLRSIISQQTAMAEQLAGQSEALDETSQQTQQIQGTTTPATASPAATAPSGTTSAASARCAPRTIRDA